MSIQSRKRVSTYGIESCVQIGHYRKRANEIASFVQTQYMKASQTKNFTKVCVSVRKVSLMIGLLKKVIKDIVFSRITLLASRIMMTIYDMISKDDSVHGQCACNKYIHIFL